MRRPGVTARDQRESPFLRSDNYVRAPARTITRGRFLHVTGKPGRDQLVRICFCANILRDRDSAGLLVAVFVSPIPLSGARGVVDGFHP